MPLYDYRCTKSHTTELDIRLNGNPPPLIVNCRHCGRFAARVFSKPMVPLMGWDAKNRRRRRHNPADTTPPDIPKARRRL
jgi:hypothetical protein